MAKRLGFDAWPRRGSRDQEQPQQLSPAAQEGLRGMREIWDLCPPEEKPQLWDALTEHCQGAASEDEEPDDLDVRGQKTGAGLDRRARAHDQQLYVQSTVKKIAQDAAEKVRRLAASSRVSRVPTFDETYPEATAIKIQY